ncbi:MAG: RnfABCDGE type electron transport complex subunit C [Oscillospiraceae bacterium]|nr:RnfABCDGE type electron transport complex subunit C [Oscillospiraceae bacterium]
MSLKKSISSLKLPHYKSTAGMAAVRMPIPKEVLIPLSPMNAHHATMSEPIVQVGDHVTVGQMIAREKDRGASHIHASVSGTVTGIEPYAMGNASGTAIRIESDGKMEKCPDLKIPQPANLDEFLQCVRDSGVVGLGGAAYPVWAKLSAAQKGHISTVLINGAECEPFITADHRVMLEHGDLIQKGIELLKQFLGSEEFIIGIEENKPDAIAQLTERFKDDPAVKIMPLSSVYPQGAKQVLLYNATGKVVEKGQRLASLGVIIINVSSLVKMAEYFVTGMPMVERIITVDGSAVKEPKNLIVPIGVSVRDVVEACGGLKEEPGKILFGGAMMGKPQESLDAHIMKATNAVVIMNRKEALKTEPSPCIHCGRCVAVCPLGLNPTAFARAMELEDPAAKAALLQKEQVKVCMQCGCCSYVCPAHRPLAENNNAGIGFLRKWEKEHPEGGK